MVTIKIWQKFHRKLKTRASFAAASVYLVWIVLYCVVLGFRTLMLWLSPGFFSSQRAIRKFASALVALPRSVIKLPKTVLQYLIRAAKVHVPPWETCRLCLLMVFYCEISIPCCSCGVTYLSKRSKSSDLLLQGCMEWKSLEVLFIVKVVCLFRVVFFGKVYFYFCWFFYLFFNY